MKLYQERHWRIPLVFSSRSLPQAFTVCTDGRKNGAAFVVFPAMGTKTKITKIPPCEGSAQYKEMMAVYIVLQEVPEPCNLYSDSSYVVNLLPLLPYAYITLDANPISALMIQLGSLLESRKKTIYIQHLRGHQNLPGLISQGNVAVDAAASGACLIEVSSLPIQNATQMHDLTHVNWRGLKYLTPRSPQQN